MSMDTKRMNDIIRYALAGKRALCRDDEERALYDEVKAEQASVAKYGATIDLIHDDPY